MCARLSITRVTLRVISLLHVFELFRLGFQFWICNRNVLVPRLGSTSKDGRLKIITVSNHHSKISAIFSLGRTEDYVW